MEKLTLDADVIHDRIDRDGKHHEDALRVFAMRDAGQVEVVAVTRVWADIPHDPLRKKLEDIEILTVPTVFRIGTSMIGYDDVASEDQVKETDGIFRLLFPHSKPEHKKYRNNVNDVDHLIGHKIAGRDIFLTRDTGMLNEQTALKHQFGIVVMSPAEYLVKKRRARRP